MWRLLITMKMLEKIKNHPYLTALSVVVIGSYIGLRSFSKPYSTVSEGIVEDEKIIMSGEKSDKHYLLYVKLKEELGEKTQERHCAFYIKENENMPVDVLDKIVNQGSTVYLPNLEQGLLPYTIPKSRYQVGCTGTIESNKLRVVNPGESSEIVKKNLEADLIKISFKEQERARIEALMEHGGRY